MIRFSLDAVSPDLAVAVWRDVKRASRAAEMPDNGVVQLYPGYWHVRSQRGKGVYVVTRTGPSSGPYSCTCPDYTYRGGECKHIKLVRRTTNDS